MLRTIQHGNGPDVVLALHDWMGDHSNYAPTLPYLDLTARRWVFADLRGYGASRELTGAYTLEEAASDVLELLAQMDAQPVHLVGHSMSSLVAQQVAAQAPERLASLVLITPANPAGLGTPPEVIGWLEQMGGTPEARAEGLGPRFAQRHGQGWADAKLAQWAEAATPQAARGYVQMFSSQAVQGTLPTSLPVLTIVGAEDDEPFTESTVRAGVGQAWPNMELVVCASAGHYPMQETPPAFAAAIERFLQQR